MGADSTVDLRMQRATGVDDDGRSRRLTTAASRLVRKVGRWIAKVLGGVWDFLTYWN